MCESDTTSIEIVPNGFQTGSETQVLSVKQDLTLDFSKSQKDQSGLLIESDIFTAPLNLSDLNN